MTLAARPLGGVPLGRETGLHLLVADVPPFVLDLDAERVRVVRDVPAANLAALWVVGVGAKAAVVGAVSRRDAKLYGDAKLYAVRGLSGWVSYLGAGMNVWPSSNGRTVWVQSHIDRSHCTLRQVGLDGRVIRARRPFPCASMIAPASRSAGLVVSRTRVIDPRTGRTVFTSPLDTFKSPLGIVAVAGEKVVLEERGKEFRLMDAATGAQRRGPWPDTPGALDLPAVDPRGRFVALAFGNPSWTSRAGQVLDVWLLDTETGKLTQLPGMPAFVALKRTNMVDARRASCAARRKRRERHGRRLAAR